MKNRVVLFLLPLRTSPLYHAVNEPQGSVVHCSKLFQGGMSSMRVKDVSKVKLGHDDGLHNGFPILERERKQHV